MAAIGRLTKRREFLAVAGRGRKTAMPGLVLQALRQGGAGEENAGLRVGFTVTKKIGNAVLRNRARRRLRAAAHAVLPSLAGAGYDVVLIARDQTLTRDFEALKADLAQALARLGVSETSP